jgi:hypothetical protein
MQAFPFLIAHLKIVQDADPPRHAPKAILSRIIKEHRARIAGARQPPRLGLDQMLMLFRQP